MGFQPGANPAGNQVPGSEMGLIGVYDMCGNYGKKSIHQWRCLVYMLIGVYDMRGNYGKKRIHQSPRVNRPISRNTAARLLVGERVPGSSGDAQGRPHLPPSHAKHKSLEMLRYLRHSLPANVVGQKKSTPFQRQTSYLSIVCTHGDIVPTDAGINSCQDVLQNLEI